MKFNEIISPSVCAPGAEEARVFAQLEDLCGEIPLPEYQTYRPPTIEYQIEYFPNPLCVLALLPLHVLCFNFFFFLLEMKMKIVNEMRRKRKGQPTTPAFSSSLDVSGSLSDSARSLSVSEFTSSSWSDSSGSLPKAFVNGGRGNI